MAKRLKFSNDVEVTKRVDDYVTRSQQLCKFFREEVVQISLKTMGETFDVLPATLSAWENGKSKAVDYIFYYYDIIVEPQYKEKFLDLIFNSDNKCIKVTALKQARNDIAKSFYACVGLNVKELEKTGELDKGIMWLSTEIVL